MTFIEPLIHLPPPPKLVCPSSREEALEVFVSNFKTRFKSSRHPTSVSLCDSCRFPGTPAQIPSSPVPTIVGTNALPTAKQAEDIHKAIQDVQPNIARLDEQIERAQGALLFLLNERQKLRDFEESHKMLLSPVRRLPPELLSEIFLSCLPEGMPRSPPNPREAPLLLTNVCRPWRCIAWSTPRLWACVMLSFRASMAPHHSTFTREWIARSGQVPLSLHLDCAAPIFEPVSFQDVVPSSARWQSVTLSMPSANVHRLSPIRHSIPMLQEVELDLTLRPGLDEPLDVFEHAPQLRSLSISGSINLDPNMLRFPWHQLTNLVVSYHDPLLVLEVMRRCEQLARCSYDIYPSEEDELVAPELRLSRLQRLSCYDGTGLLNTLTLPALLELEISPFSLSHTVWLPRLNSLISRSQCRLTKLALLTGRMGGAELCDCLERTPHLTELDISCGAVSNHDLTDVLLSQLTATDRAPPLLPSLRRLKLSTGPPCRLDLVARMAESRWRVPAIDAQVEQIQSIYVCIESPAVSHSVDEEALACLNALRAEGLDWSIHFKTIV